MDIFYEYIKSKIRGMISTSQLNINILNIKLDNFISFLEEYYSISESNFNYKLDYWNQKNVKREINNYIVLNNKIYLDIKTYSKNSTDDDFSDSSNIKIETLTAYCSQDNNKKLIQFMNKINSFIIKNKQDKDNV